MKAEPSPITLWEFLAGALVELVVLAFIHVAANEHVEAVAENAQRTGAVHHADFGISDLTDKRRLRRRVEAGRSAEKQRQQAANRFFNLYYKILSLYICQIFHSKRVQASGASAPLPQPSFKLPLQKSE